MGALEEVRDLAEAVTQRRSLLLWDVEMGGQPGSAVVRVFVDSATGGVDLDTVAQISEEISRGLDMKDPIAGRYTLEVSSPGLERTLTSPTHFEMCVGKKVVMKTKQRMFGDSHRVEGVISSAGSDSVKLDVNEAPVEVPYDEIKSARTVFEWN
jgi:ribosome maturation factor RimP